MADVIVSKEASLKLMIERERAKYPDVQSLIIDALHFVNGRDGYIARDSVTQIAELTGVTPARVWGVATFYTMFNRRPVGKYFIQVCTNISCSLRGGYAVVRHLEEKLKIRVGETTADKKFTLTEVECLGACGTAPVVQINDEYYENVDAARIDAILAGLE